MNGRCLIGVDLGTSLLFLPTLVLVLFAAGARKRHIATVVVLGLLSSPLLWQGMSNDQIAERLVISPATARHHVSACISKLGAANRAQAAALAVHHKLIP